MPFLYKRHRLVSDTKIKPVKVQLAKAEGLSFTQDSF